MLVYHGESARERQRQKMWKYFFKIPLCVLLSFIHSGWHYWGWNVFFGVSEGRGVGEEGVKKWNPIVHVVWAAAAERKEHWRAIFIIYSYTYVTHKHLYGYCCRFTKRGLFSLPHTFTSSILCALLSSLSVVRSLTRKIFSLLFGNFTTACSINKCT